MTEKWFNTGKGERCAMALGWFDGLHIGHTALIERTVEAAREDGLYTAVWTFEGSKHAGSDNSPGFILSDDEKEAILHRLGTDVLYTAKFQEIKDMSPEDFVQQIVIGQCRCDIAVCGFNYRFGAGGAGDAETLSFLMRKAGKRALIIPPVTLDGNTVSSTEIRSLIASGNPEKATALLGRPYSLDTDIVHGRRIGHKLGVPTVNQSFQSGAIIPKHGVYVTEVSVDGKTYRAVSNVGVRPTFGREGPVVCESNLLSGNPGECYGKPASTRFLSFIRPEIRFDSPELLKAQIEKDISVASKYFDRK